MKFFNLIFWPSSGANVLVNNNLLLLLLLLLPLLLLLLRFLLFLLLLVSIFATHLSLATFSKRAVSPVPPPPL